MFYNNTREKEVNNVLGIDPQCAYGILEETQVRDLIDFGSVSPRSGKGSDFSPEERMYSGEDSEVVRFDFKLKSDPYIVFDLDEDFGEDTVVTRDEILRRRNDPDNTYCISCGRIMTNENPSS